MPGIRVEVYDYDFGEEPDPLLNIGDTASHVTNADGYFDFDIARGEESTTNWPEVYFRFFHNDTELLDMMAASGTYFRGIQLKRRYNDQHLTDTLLANDPGGFIDVEAVTIVDIDDVITMQFGVMNIEGPVVTEDLLLVRCKLVSASTGRALSNIEFAATDAENPTAAPGTATDTLGRAEESVSAPGWPNINLVLRQGMVAAIDLQRDFACHLSGSVLEALAQLNGVQQAGPELFSGDASGIINTESVTVVGATAGYKAIIDLGTITVPTLEASGTLYDLDWNPAGNEQLNFHRATEVENGPLMASATTDAQGNYQLSLLLYAGESLDYYYTWPSEHNPQPGAAPRLSSDAFYAAQQSEAATLVMAPADAPEGARAKSEYRAIGEVIDSSPAGAATNAGRVSFIYRSKRVKPLLVAWYLRANSTVAKLQTAGIAGQLTAQVFYALYRAGLSRKLNRLAAESPAILTKALERAIAERWVAPTLGFSNWNDAVPAAVNELGRLAIDLSLHDEGTSNESPLLPLLRLSGMTDVAAMRQLIEDYNAFQGPKSKFWDSDDPDTTDLPLLLDLWRITKRYQPMVERLYNLETAIGNSPAIRTRSLADLAWLTLEEWQYQVAELGELPDDMPTAAAYANRMFTMVQTAESNAGTAAHIMRDGAWPHPEGFDTANLHEFLGKYVWNHEPAFDFGITIANSFEIDSADEQYIDYPALLPELKRIQRIYRLAPKLNKASICRVLLASYGSALEIFKLGRSRFVGQHSNDAIPEDNLGEAQARSTFYRARQVVATTEFLRATYKRHAGVFSNLILPDDQFENDANGPDWATLFGQPTAAECDHCQSEYSPAAYLVALLDFTEQLDAFDVLDAKRPDIKQLELSCANTDTVMPGIDVVCELLEDHVLAWHNPELAQLNSRQTTLSATELSLAPEYINSAAYEVLRDEVHPFGAGMNWWHRQCGTWLEHLGAGRAALMEALNAQPEGEPLSEHPSWTAEVLGVNVHQLDLIAGTTDLPQSQRWGMPEDLYSEENGWSWPWTSEVARASTFIKQTGYTLDQLKQLFGTRYVQQGGSPFIIYATDETGVTSYDLDNASVVKLVDDGQETISIRDHTYPVPEGAQQLSVLEAEDFDRIEQFIRLQRALNIDIATLDTLIFALGNPTNTGQMGFHIDLELLQSAAGVIQLQRELEQPIAPVVSWFSPLDTWRNPGIDHARSHYETVFYNRANPIDPVFELDEAGTELANTSAEIKLHYGALAAALHITVEDAARLVEWQLPADATLNLAVLTELYRYTTFATANGITVANLIELGALLGDINLAEPTQLYVTDLLNKIATIKAHPLGFAALDYLFNYTIDGAAEHTEKQESQAVSALLGALKTNLGKLDQQNATEQQRHDFLVNTVASAYGLSASIVSILMGDWLKIGSAFIAEVLLDFSADGYEDQQSPQSAACLLLHKCALLITGLNINPAELAIISQHNNTGAVPFLDFAALPVDNTTPSVATNDWLELLHIIGLRNALNKHPEYSIWDALVEARELGIGLPVTALVPAISRFSAWDQAVVEALLTELSFSVSELTTSTGYERLSRAVQYHQRLGVSVDELIAFAHLDAFTDAPDSNDEPLALSSLQAAKSRYSTVRWPEVAKPINDALREERRNALIAYLLNWYNTSDYDVSTGAETTAPAYSSEHDLFDALLIDVQVSACANTSRMVAAISSVQLHIQRCMLGLEPEVQVSNYDREAWEWQKRYRIWEAAKKVFLYPENWLEPELRPGQSELFEALSGQLLKGALTEDSAKDAMKTYLQTFRDTANLRIAATYYHVAPSEADPSVDSTITHVLARTHQQPAHYYYRACTDGEWSPWAKTNLQVEGGQVVLVQWNQSLYALWLVGREMAKGDPLEYYYEFQLAASEFVMPGKPGQTGTWKQHTMLPGVVQSYPFSELHSLEKFFLHIEEQSETSDLRITPFQYWSEQIYTQLNSVVLRKDGSSEVVELEEAVTFSPRLPWGAFLSNMAAREGAESALWLNVSDLDAEAEDAYEHTLDATPGVYRVHWSMQYQQFVSQAPFFFTNEAETYYVEPFDTEASDTLKSTSSTIMVTTASQLLADAEAALEHNYASE